MYVPKKYVMELQQSGLEILSLNEKVDFIKLLPCCKGISSVAQSCPILCDPVDCSTSGFPVHHQLTEIAQTHVCQVGDANQPSHPLLSPSPQTSGFPASGSFPVSSLHQLAKVLELQLQLWSFQ